MMAAFFRPAHDKGVIVMKPKNSNLGLPGLLVCLIAMLVMGGCQIAPSKMNALLVASSDVNADASGRAFPVVVRVYELVSNDAFVTADFFELFDNESETLGADLIAREEYELAPNEERLIRQDLDKNTRHIGVVAAFRQIENAEWARTVQVRSRRSNRISIQVRRSSVVITSRQ